MRAFGLGCRSSGGAPLSLVSRRGKGICRELHQDRVKRRDVRRNPMSDLFESNSNDFNRPFD